MAPLLNTEAQVVELTLRESSFNRSSIEKTEAKVNGGGLYKLTAKKNKVSLKPVEKNFAKLKPVKYKKINEIHANDRSNIVSMAFDRSKKRSNILGIKFKNSATRKEFQNLVLESNPQVMIHNKDDNLNEDDYYDSDEEVSRQKSKTTKKSTKYESDMDAGSQRFPSPEQQQQQMQPPYQQQQQPSRAPRRAGSICSHCYQVIQNGYNANNYDYVPSINSEGSEGDKKYKSSCITYLGPKKSSPEVLRPRKRVQSYSSYDNDGSSAASTMSAGSYDGRGKEVVTVTCATPATIRRARIVKSPSRPVSRGGGSGSRKNCSRNTSAVYLIYDSSSDDDSDYSESSSTSDYSDSLYSSDSSYSAPLKTVEKLLRELRRTGSVRLN